MLEKVSRDSNSTAFATIIIDKASAVAAAVTAVINKAGRTAAVMCEGCFLVISTVTPILPRWSKGSNEHLVVGNK
jgi:hypothetical protein